MTKQLLAAKNDLTADGMTLREMLWGVPTLYHVPLFQRKFVWGAKEFDKLWSDIGAVVDGLVKTRFLGAIVLQDISTQLPGRPSEYVLVDGQQRLTTLFVLLVALAELAAAFEEGHVLAEDLVASALLNSVPTARGIPKIAPPLQDRAQFHGIVSRLGGVTNLPASPPQAYGPQSGPLASMFDRIKLRLEKELGAAIDQARNAAQDIVNPGTPNDSLWTPEHESAIRLQYLENLYAVVLDRLKFVGISLGADDDPHQVFDRLNSAGIQLKVSDLVRNEVFLRLSDDPASALALSEGAWAVFELTLGDKFEDFVFAYGLIAKSSTTKGSLLGDLRDRWGPTEGSPSWTAQKILDDMNKYLPAFMAIAAPGPTYAVGGKIANLPVSLRRQIERLRRMPIPSSVYPYAVMVIQAATEKQVGAKAAERDLLLVESFLVRRAFAGLEPTGLHAVFKSMWDDAGGDPAGLVKSIERRKTIRFPSDAEFELDIAARSVYSMRLIGHVLRAYEESLPGDDVPPGLILTVDHVMPQRLGSGWSVSSADHARLLSTWANLVPMSGPGNSAKGNQPWPKVRERLKTEAIWKTPRLIASQYAVWGTEQIDKRRNALTPWALKRWPRKA